jgi:hypothetical protein
LLSIKNLTRVYVITYAILAFEIIVEYGKRQFIAQVVGSEVVPCEIKLMRSILQVIRQSNCPQTPKDFFYLGFTKKFYMTW